MLPLGLNDVLRARERIRNEIRQTPTRLSDGLSHAAGHEVYLKLENEQPTGSFKIRGAANAIAAQVERGARGVTTASTGNHARAVAHLGRRHRLEVRAFVSHETSQQRIETLRAMSAHVDATAVDQTDAIRRAREYASVHRLGFVPPFDDPTVIAGQGTLGFELAQVRPSFDVVVVPVSGGGLAAGVALAIRSLALQTRVIGVCAARAPAMKRALEAGHPIAVAEEPTVAESLRGDLGDNNRYTFRMVRDLVDEVALVSEEAIIEAHKALDDLEGLTVEPAAAAAVAHIRTRPDTLHDRRVIAVVTGGDH